MPIASKIGYTWNGWYTESTNGSKVATNANQPIITGAVSGWTNASKEWIFTTTEDRTLNAQYTVNKYNVVFATANNACPLDATVYANITNISYGNNIKNSAIVNPTCTGWTFTGWTATGDVNTSEAKYGTNSSPNTAWVNENKGTYFKNLSTTSDGTVTLTAGWSSSDISFDSQTLSSGTYGTTYTSTAFTGASGGTGNYTYTIKSGAPNGATINSSNRTISFTDTTAAGEYNVIVTAKDNVSNATTDATMKIVINKRVVTVTAPTTVSDTLTYNGNDQNLLSSVGSCSTGGVMYWYQSNPIISNTTPTFSTSSGWTITAPTTTSYKGNDAGTYYIWYYCYVENTENNEGININTVKNVTKSIGTTSDQITITKQTVTYDGNTHTTSVSTTSGLTPTVTYYINSNCTTETTTSNSGAATTGSAPQDAKTYYVIASTNGNNNYDSTSKTCTEALVIQKKEITVTWQNETNFTYNGSAQAPTTSADTGVTNESMTVTRTTPGTNYQTSNYTSVASCSSVTGGRASCNNYTLTGNSKNYKIIKYTPTLSLSSEVGEVDALTEKTFTVNLEVINACKGTLTAQSEDSNKVSITSGASTSNATSDVQVKWKGLESTDATGGVYINANYTPNDTSNCNTAEEVSYTARVNKLTPTITLSDREVTYTGNSVSGTGATAKVGTNNVSLSYNYKYYSDSNCQNNETTTAPINAGSYYLKAISIETGVYSSASSNCALLKINPYTPSLSLNNSSGTVNFNLSTNFKATPTTISNCVGSLSAVVENSSNNIEITSGANANNVASGTETMITWKGKHYTTGTNINISYTPNDTTNCSNTTISYSAIVNKIDATCPTLGAYNNIYDGSSHGISVSNGSGGTIEYSANGTSGWSSSPIKITNVSDSPKTVYVRVNADSDHITKTCGSSTITITTRPITVRATDQSKVYDGTALTADSSCSVTSGSLISGESVTCNNSGSQTEVGSSTKTLNSVTINNGSVSNYNITRVNGTLEVTNAGVATIPTASSYCKTGLIYDGSEKVLTNAAGNGYSFSDNTGINADSYTVTATLNQGWKWTDNGTGPKTITCSIAPREITITAGSSSRAYNGSPLTNSTCTATNLAGGHTVTCTMTSESTITNVGSVNNVISTPTIKENSTNINLNNYSITYVNGTLTITPSLTATTGSCASGLIYNGQNQTLASGASHATYEDNSKINADTYTVTVNADNNYAFSNGDTTKTLSCTISPFEIDFTFYKNGASTQTTASGVAVTDNVVTRHCVLTNSSVCSITSPTIVGSSYTPNVIGYNTSQNSHSSMWNHNTQKSITINLTGNNVTEYYAQTSSNALTHSIEFNANGNTITTPLPTGCTGNSSTATCSCTTTMSYNGVEASSQCSMIFPSYTAPTGFSAIGWTVSSSNHSNGIEGGTSRDVSNSGNYWAQSEKSAITYNVTFDKTDATTINNESDNITESCTIEAAYNGSSQETSCSVTAPSIQWPISGSSDYRLILWSDRASTPTTYNPDANISVSSDKTLYAVTCDWQYTSGSTWASYCKGFSTQQYTLATNIITTYSVDARYTSTGTYKCSQGFKCTSGCSVSETDSNRNTAINKCSSSQTSLCVSQCGSMSYCSVYGCQGATAQYKCQNYRWTCTR